MRGTSIVSGALLIVCACDRATSPTHRADQLLSRSVSASGTFVVNSTLDAIDANPGDGVCATAAASCTLRAAILEANALPGDDAIRLPAGLYVLTLAGSNEDAGATGDLDVLDNLSITGAGAASTIIDGNGSVMGDRVIHIRGATVLMSSLTIRGGDAPLFGGLFNEAGVTTLSRVTVRNNASLQCAGIANFGAMTIVNSVVSANRATNCAGIGNFGALTVRSSSVVGNSADGGGHPAGGDGGGIYNEGTLVLERSTVGENTGLGIRNNFSPSRLVITNSSIIGNTGFRGAGIRIQEGMVVITNSTFSGNVATEMGGAIFNIDGVMTITNSTFAGNSAALGGNVLGEARSVTTLRNTLAVSQSGVNCLGAIVDGGGNLSWPDATCPGLNANPLVGPLANNGGATRTHALLAGSPAIDAAILAQCPRADQRGVERPRGPGCDIGAFER